MSALTIDVLFAFLHGGSFLGCKPSFDPALARRSPGEVLLRQLLMHADADGPRSFDFGLGHEAFKRRFATRSETVGTPGLHPRRSRTAPVGR